MYNSTRPLKNPPLLPKVAVGKHKPQEKPCTGTQRNSHPSLKPYRTNFKQRLKQDCTKLTMIVCEDSEEDGCHRSHWNPGLLGLRVWRIHTQGLLDYSSMYRIDFSVSICLITYGMCTKLILQILSELIYASIPCSW